MSPSNADIISALPNPDNNPIIMLLLYKPINAIHLILNQNASSVDSNLGGVQNGILYLTVYVAVYNNLYTIAFI